MTDTVPLNKLVISPRNVRKTNGEEDIAGLAESIRSKGLLQNLVVSQSTDGKLFEVDAGGRRLRALQLLAAKQRIAKNWPVPVHIIAADAATEASLAENLQKIAMNPADEVEAFATIVAGYEANGMISRAEQIANCARRFGVTERHVAQRLALADLASEILDALRDGRIGLAAASAYASHPDHKEQIKVFKAHEKKHEGAWGRHAPREVRDTLAGRVFPIDHKLARYVGLDSYEEAGGRIDTDLFFEEGDRQILLDPALLEKLATSKALAEAKEKAKKDGWLDGVIKPVSGPLWQEPANPKGFTKQNSDSGRIGLRARAKAIACYALNDAGVLQVLQTWFLKEEPTEARQIISPAERDAQWQTERRESEIRYRAAKLAAPKVTGTPLEGKALWPRDVAWIQPFTEDEDGDFLVALLIKVPKTESEAYLAEAERRYELEQQELAEEIAAIEAEDQGELEEEPTG